MTASLASLAATQRWDAWDRFLAATPHAGFMQSSWWADFRTLAGFQHFAVILKHEGAVLGGAVVQQFEYAPGHCFYYIPEGPVLPDEEGVDADVFQAVLAAIAERRAGTDATVSHVRLEPRWERLPPFVQGFREVPRFQDGFMEPRHTLCVNLRPSERVILDQMKPKGRYNVGIAQRHQVSTVEDASERGLQDFLTIYAATTGRHGLEAKPPDYFADLIAGLTSLGHGSLFFAEHAGRRVACALVVFFGTRATYFYGGSLEQDRRVMAPYLLHYQIMRLAKARGHEWYDFWGVAPEDEPDHPWQNISVFKRKFGGRDFRLVPTMDYVFDPDAYNHYLTHQAR